MNFKIKKEYKNQQLNLPGRVIIINDNISFEEVEILKKIKHPSLILIKKDIIKKSNKKKEIESLLINDNGDNSNNINEN